MIKILIKSNNVLYSLENENFIVVDSISLNNFLTYGLDSLNGIIDKINAELTPPISIMAYSDTNINLSLLQQYDYPNVGARILKRG